MPRTKPKPKQEPLRRKSTLWTKVAECASRLEAVDPCDLKARRELEERAALLRTIAELQDSLMGLEDRADDINLTLQTALGKGSPLVSALWAIAKKEEAKSHDE